MLVAPGQTPQAPHYEATTWEAIAAILRDALARDSYELAMAERAAERLVVPGQHEIRREAEPHAGAVGRVLQVVAHSEGERRLGGRHHTAHR